MVYGTSSYQFAVPTKVGFTFNGWKVLVNGSYQFYTDSQGKANRVWDIANDVTVVADWTRHTYYVKVNSDGTIAWLSENGFTNTQTGIEYGSVFSDADDLINIFKLEDGGVIFVRSVIQANQYQVTYVNTYGQSSVSATMVTYDTTPQYASVTEVTGRAFVGWYTGSNGTGTKLSDADGEGICTWKYAQDKTVYAYWIAVPYEITYNLNGGSYASGVSNPTVYTIDTATITLKAPIRSGYSFKGWKNAVTGVIVSTIPKGSTGALSFIAQWTPLYTISFSANGGSSCSSITAEANAMIKLPTSTRAGYMGTWNGYAFGST